MHSEYSALRLKGFKQTVNPSYSEIFNTKPDEFDKLMGKAPISEQMKSCEDLQKIKNKLKKQESNQHNTQRFRKGGDFRRKSGFQRNARSNYNKRRYDDRRNRQFSPRRTFPKKGGQSDKENKMAFQEERKVSSRRN